MKERPMAMLWQRFTERAKRVVIAAQENAATEGEPYVSPEHLLMALCEIRDCAGARILERLGINLNRLKKEVQDRIGWRQRAAVPTSDVTLDPRMKRVLDFAYDEARKLNNNYIGT